MLLTTHENKRRCASPRDGNNYFLRDTNKEGEEQFSTRVTHFENPRHKVEIFFDKARIDARLDGRNAIPVHYKREDILWMTVTRSRGIVRALVQSPMCAC